MDDATESTTSVSDIGDVSPRLTIDNARRDFRQRDLNEHHCYLNQMKPSMFAPYPSDLSIKFLHHDANKDAVDKTDSSWFYGTEIDINRVASCTLIKGTVYSPIGDLLNLYMAKCNTLLLQVLYDFKERYSDGFRVKNMKLCMPQLTPPRQTSQGSGIRPRVVNQYVYVPSPNENNVMLTFSRTDTMDVLCQTKICFDVLLDDVTVHSVTVEYDNVTRRPVLRMGSYTPRILNEEQARSVLDPRSWSQATVDQYRDKSKCPLLRAMIELIVKCSKDRMPIEFADLLEHAIGDSFKEGHAFDLVCGRWKEDPSYATRRDNANREISGFLSRLIHEMGALLKPQIDQGSNDHPNLNPMVTYLFEIRAPFVMSALIEAWNVEKKNQEAHNDEAEGGANAEDEATAPPEWGDINKEDPEQFAIVCTAIRTCLLGAGQASRSNPLVVISKKMETEIIENVRSRFCEPGFLELLDANKYLLPFMDGVYELRTGVFRQLRPTDYVTRSIPYSFAEVQKYLAMSNLEATDPTGKRKNLIEVLKRIYPQCDEKTGKHDIFEYAMSSLFAQMLCGDQGLTAEGHKIVNHTGNTRNGKTFIQALLLSVFGDAGATSSGAPAGFFVSPKMCLYTTVEQANGHTADLLPLHQSRCICIDEANNDTKNPVQEAILKKHSGGGMVKGRKCHGKDLQNISMHGQGIQFFGQFTLQMQSDEALDQRRRNIRYEAFFARNEKERTDMMAKGYNPDYIFQANPTLDRDEQRREWAPVFMALLIDRWERYHLGRDDIVATWTDATPPGTWPPIPPLVHEWTDADKGGGDENQYQAWVNEHVILCGSPGALCSGWAQDGKWTCKHFLVFSEHVKTAMESTAQGLFNKGKSTRGLDGAVKVFEGATGRKVIPKLSDHEKVRVCATSRHNKVFPAMQLRHATAPALSSSSVSMPPQAPSSPLRAPTSA